MPVDLQYRYFGGEGKPPLVILHGLFGSSRNWIAAGKDLARLFEVFALDLRNHGASPHHPSMTFEEMEKDLHAWLLKQELKRVSLLGHSLGGKVAMLFACLHPEMLRALIVADISPVERSSVPAAIFEALRKIDLDEIKCRRDAEERLASEIANRSIRQFLLTNLKGGPDGRFHWQIPLSILEASLPAFSRSSLQLHHRFDGPTLFIRGALSKHIRDEDRETMAALFPQYILSTIQGAGHFVHSDQRAAFVDSIRYFQEEQFGAKSLGKGRG